MNSLKPLRRRAGRAVLFVRKAWNDDLAAALFLGWPFPTVASLFFPWQYCWAALFLFMLLILAVKARRALSDKSPPRRQVPVEQKISPYQVEQLLTRYVEERCSTLESVIVVRELLVALDEKVSLAKERETS